MNEHETDRLLGIRTAGIQDWGLRSIHDNRYEATPYEGLEALVEEYRISKTSSVVDFGCGKGRTAFYINHRTGTFVTGVEMDGQLYLDALENRDLYMIKKKNRLRGSVTFIRSRAEEYRVNPIDDVFYFFNPFSVSLFAKVLSNILESMEECPRTVDLILYYPTLDYLSHLENHSPFVHVKDVLVPELAEKNPNERFSIWRFDRSK
ncbi:hypothetical protein SAMN04488126_12526 [Bhargavaea beijingensis]|uniref:Methyltransferase domain-containing protein n=1 Tax=Bhargavaea beijingensis TaxID=426756 RepID=A0A1G7GCB2_9BACL|nr:class I SAM-dependent methyltransferase [Bhargavaea beijingensis]SDE85756.1 hypothetical protein SAMN04488126_12526 [Bhargavaea beijingensis]